MAIRTRFVVIICFLVGFAYVHLFDSPSTVAGGIQTGESERQATTERHEGQKEANSTRSGTLFLNVSRTMALDLLSWEIDSIPYPDPNATAELQAMMTNETTWDKTIQNLTEANRTMQLKERKKREQVLKTRFTGGICAPPEGQQVCCIGSSSTGGGQKFMPQVCNHGAEPYDAVRKDALQLLNRTAFAVDNDCDICRIIDAVVANNLTLNFIGDSVQRQVFAGFSCELRRRGYNLTETKEKWTRPKDLFWRLGVSGVTAITISTNIGKGATTVRFYDQYLPNIKNMSEMEQITQGSDILVFNVGVHVFEQFQQGAIDQLNRHYEIRYKEAIMMPLLEIFRKHNLTMPVHRETTAQHFDGPGGAFWLKKQNSEDRNRCVPLKDGDPAAGWRERSVLAAANESGYHIVMGDESIVENLAVHAANGHVMEELVILPFFNFTARHHDLHPGECTHYCHTPYLWLPLWRSLRLAVDRKFGYNVGVKANIL